MKQWHFMAKIYESANMQLINISSGVISTPNSMNATDTINYLSKMVADQQKQKPGPEEVTIAFEAFGLVESDDTEPAAPLTDEDIAQHRHDDKVEAQAFAAAGLIGMSHKDVFDHLDGIKSDRGATE